MTDAGPVAESTPAGRPMCRQGDGRMLNRAVPDREIRSMSLQLTDEQIGMVETIRRFAARECRTRTSAWPDQRRHDAPQRRDLPQAGGSGLSRSVRSSRRTAGRGRSGWRTSGWSKEIAYNQIPAGLAVTRDRRARLSELRLGGTEREIPGNVVAGGATAHRDVRNRARDPT